jgi:hypothetical protein
MPLYWGPIESAPFRVRILYFQVAEKFNFPLHTKQHVNRLANPSSMKERLKFCHMPRKHN